MSRGWAARRRSRLAAALEWLAQLQTFPGVDGRVMEWVGV